MPPNSPRHPTHIVASGALVTRSPDEVLLVRTRRRGWVLPGGQVEVGESLIDAVRREILEEAGIEVELGPLVGVYSNVTPPTKVIFAFLAKWLRGEARADDETDEVGWFPRSAALELVTPGPELDRVRDALEFEGTVRYRVYSTGPYDIQEESTL